MHRLTLKPIIKGAAGTLPESIQHFVGYQPSHYQQAVIDFLLSGDGNGACNAVAGSGKSSTLIIAAIALANKGIPASALRALVFGKANAKDLQDKFGKIGRNWKRCASTLHSVGFGLMMKEIDKKADVCGFKYRRIAQDRGYLSDGDQQGSLVQDEICSESDFLKLIDLVRLTNQPACAQVIGDLAAQHEVELTEFSLAAEAVKVCLQVGQTTARAKGLLDFTDMVWLPVEWQLDTRPWFRAYDYLFVDECQDLNQCQLTLTLMLAGQVSGYRGSPGRILFVGDPFQAIMGFAGADCDSYRNIVEQTKAIQLPLSTCYRCPKTHIDLVKRMFPDIPIEPRLDAPLGEVQIIGENQLQSTLRTGDMVLARKTTPLVKLCIQLITDGISATVKGRDIGDTLKREIENIAKLPGFNFSQFGQFIEEYATLKATRYEQLENGEQLLELLSDKLDAVKAIYASQVNATCISDLSACVDKLFKDGDNPQVVLATVHRSKGLENERIFLLRPNDLPLTWEGQRSWQLQQEYNLLYVALTRSTSELIFVGEPDWLLSTLPSQTATKPGPDAAIASLCKEFGTQAVTQSLLRSASLDDLDSIICLIADF